MNLIAKFSKANFNGKYSYCCLFLASALNSYWVCRHAPPPRYLFGSAVWVNKPPEEPEPILALASAPPRRQTRSGIFLKPGSALPIKVHRYPSVDLVVFRPGAASTSASGALLRIGKF